MGEVKLTPEWLGEVGFKWSQEARQPHKHWRLNLGWAADGGMFSTPNDLYVEVTPAWWFNRSGDRVQAGTGDPWHCWIGGDGRGFVHVRHLQTQSDLIALMEALTGLSWDPANNHYGQMHTPERAAVHSTGSIADEPAVTNGQ